MVQGDFCIFSLQTKSKMGSVQTCYGHIFTLTYAVTHTASFSFSHIWAHMHVHRYAHMYVWISIHRWVNTHFLAHVCTHTDTDLDSQTVKRSKIKEHTFTFCDPHIRTQMTYLFLFPCLCCCARTLVCTVRATHWLWYIIILFHPRGGHNPSSGAYLYFTH